MQGILFQGMEDPNHSKLDDIRRRSLDGGIQGNALCAGADVEVTAADLRQISAPSKGSGYIAVSLRRFHNILHILPYTGVFAQIALNIGLGLIAADSDVLGQGELGNAVDDAEIDRLGIASHLGCDLFYRHIENLGGRDSGNPPRNGMHLP